MKKIVVTLLILVLVAGLGVWYFVSFRMDSMIRDQIEMAGSGSLGSQVSVGSVKTNIKDGSLNISEVTVANPPGYKNKNAISLNGIEAALDYSNFDIKRVVIDNPEIIIEEMGGKTNFTDLLAGLEKSGSGTGAASDAPADGKPEPVIVVHHFRMNASRAAFESASLEHYSDIKIDSVELNDLRGTPTEIAKVIANEIVSEVTQAAAIELLKAQASKQLDKAGGKISSKLKGLFGGDDEEASEDEANDPGGEGGNQ